MRHGLLPCLPLAAAVAAGVACQPSSPRSPVVTAPAPAAIGACGRGGFCWQSPVPVAGDLTGVWGSSARDVYAIGVGGVVLHFDGASWREEASGTDARLLSIWGSGPGDVFVVGDRGAILHRGAGGAWQAEKSGTDEILEAVWGSGPGDVFAVGWNGLVLHHDGRAWAPQPTATRAILNAVWGSGPKDVYAVGTLTDKGRRGVVLHYDGAAWGPPRFLGHSLGAVWGVGPAEVYVAGEDDKDALGVWRFDGTDFRPEAIPATGRLMALAGVGGQPVLVGLRDTSHENLISFGTGAVFTAERTGGAWRAADQFTVSEPIGQQNFRLWGGGPGEAFIVGWWGTVARLDGKGYTVTNNAAGGGKNLMGIGGRSPSDVFAVGVRGTILHHDGRTWAAEPSGTDHDLTAVHCAAGAVVAAGRKGTLLARDGSTWRPRVTGTESDLWAVWIGEGGAVFAAGDHGTILRCDAARCEAMPTGATEDLAAVWGRSPRDVFAGGAAGAILHYDGVRWTRLASPVREPVRAIGDDGRGGVMALTHDSTLRLDPAGVERVAAGGGWALWATGPSEVVALFGGGGADLGIRRFDGKAWHDEPLGMGAYGENGAVPRGIWGAAGELFVVGDGGAILHRPR